jgi:hypothetical protein
LLERVFKDTKISALKFKHAAVVDLHVEHFVIVHKASVQRRYRVYAYYYQAIQY